MNNYILEKNADYVATQSMASKRAVFVINDKAKTMDPEGSRFERMLLDFPDAFVGVYDNGCDLNRIREDIQETPVVCRRRLIVTKTEDKSY